MKLNKDNFAERATDFHNGEYTYAKVNYTGRGNEITVTCPTHGDFTTTPKNHLRAGHCPTCKPSPITSEAEYILRASATHMNLYTYESTVFTKSCEKSKVTCKSHGDFLISPNNHLRGKGCPECANTKKGWGRTKYVGAPAILYLVLVNNSLFKIGITKKTVRERYAKDTKDGNTIAILLEVHCLHGEDAFDLERLLLQDTKDLLYKGPAVLTHGGDTELRTKDCTAQVIKRVKELHETHRTRIQPITS